MPQGRHWSSASAHIAGQDDMLVKVSPLKKMVSGDWREFLQLPVEEDELTLILRHERTGRPLGDKNIKRRKPFKPIIPPLHYSIIPIAERSEAKFSLTP